MDAQRVEKELGYSSEELLRMYQHLVRGRIFTLVMHEAVKQGRLRSSFHSPHGQEAGGIALLSAMGKQDWFAASHRVQSAAIMRYDVYQYMCELFSRRDGYRHGTVFDFHGSDFGEGRMLIPSAILGSIASTYTGFAWARMRQGFDDIVAISLGDGACSEGSVYEAWNIATLYKAPVVYVIENNGWAMTVPLERQTVNPDISDRAKAFGMHTQIVDGDDLLACRRAMDTAVAMARKGQPNVVELKYKRWSAHYFGQNDALYRNDMEEIKQHQVTRDCVTLYENLLLKYGVITPAYVEQFKANTEAEMVALSDKASAAPYTTKEDAFKKEYIYANTDTGGDL